MALSLKPIQIVEKNKYQLLVKAPHWKRVFLKCVAEVHNGYAFESKFFTKNKGTPLIRIRDISKEDTENYYDGNYQEFYLVNKGDILIGMDGDFNVAIWQGKLGLLNQRVCRVKIHSNFYSEKFLFLCLQPYLDAINSETSSVTVKHLSSQTVEDIPLPLPPLPEQHRIVAKIEELFTQLDAGVELLKKVKAKLKRYRQAVLKAAVEGELTREWRTAHQGELEPASVLLDRILKQRREKWEAEQLAKMKAQGKTPKDDSWKLKYKEPVAPDISDLAELPDGWCLATVEQLALSEKGSIQSGPFGSNLLHSEFQSSGILAIGIDNVLTGKFSTGKEHRISVEKYQELKKYTARPLDVLITVMATVGRCCVVPENIETAIITKHVYRISVNQTIANSYYIMFTLLGGIEVREQIFSQVRGQTRPGINGEILKKVSIPIPSLLEQNKIVGDLERILSVTDELEKTIDTNLKRADKLRQTILKEAFEGKLVPQNLNDEPAEKLLERIQAEKFAQESEKKSQRQPKIKSTQPRKSKKTSTQLELNLNNQNG